jgi:hypothetical protein
LNGYGRLRTAFFIDIANIAQRVTFYIKTDVNISVRMIADCVLDATDTIVLVSADSDLVPPLEFIQKHYPEKRIKVYFPPSNFSCD